MAKNREAQLIWKPTATLGASLFFLSFGSLALVFLFFYPRKGLFDWLLFITYCFWTGGGLCGTIYGLRTRVEANENGLSWRDWRGVWRAAKWEEIHDFHLEASRKTTNYNVETTQGNFQFDSLGDGKAIADLVAQRATNAPVRDWEIQGERLCDQWPRRFEFCSSGRNNAVIFSLLVLLLSLVLVAASLLFWVPPRADLSLAVWFLAYVGPLLLLPVLPLVICFFVLVRANEARRFRGQSVEVSPQKLVFDGANRIETTWLQIETWEWIKRGRTQFLRLQTVSGTIEIPSFIAGFGALCRILERFGGVALVKEFEEGALPAIPVQTAPDDTLIFSFYDVNAWMWSRIFIPHGLVMLLMPLLFRISDPQTPPRNSPPSFGVGISFILLSLALHWWLKNAQLRLTRQSLEWRAPFLNRVVAWKDIESFGSTTGSSGWIQVAGKKISLSLGIAAVAQRSRLREEIEKRTFNAKGGWQ